MMMNAFCQIRQWTGRSIGALLLLALGALYIFPFLWMIATSLKTAAETMLFPPTLLPAEFQFGNYLRVFQNGPFLRFFLNSVFVSVSIVVLEIAVAVPAAYAFAKLRFRFSGIFFGVILSGMLIPMQVTVLPVYLMFSKLGLVNTYTALILPFITSAFGIFLLTQTFKQIPNELLEAARMDGSSEWRIMWRMMLPMSGPALTTLALFIFIMHWNDLFWVMVMTTSDAFRTLTVGIMRLKDTDSLQWNILMAGNVVLVAPVMLIYLFASRKIKAAFAYGGMK